MAVPTNTVQTPSRNTIPEMVQSYIYNLDPIATPVMTSLKRKPIRNVKFEWLEDSLATPADNEVVQGDDASFDTAPSPTRLQNYTQIMDKALVVSDTARSVNNYGYRDELAYQMSKKSKEVKREMEQWIMGNKASKAPTATVAGNTASIPAWIKSYVTTKETSSATTAYSAGGYNSGSGLVAAHTLPGPAAGLGDWGEQDIRNLVTNIVENTMGNPRLIVMSVKNKESASRLLTGINTGYRDSGMSTKPLSIIGAVSMYRSDFGMHRLMYDRFMHKNIIVAMDPRYWSMGYLQRFSVRRLARTGHAEKRLLKVEFGICAHQEKASGMLVGVKDGGITT